MAAKRKEFLLRVDEALWREVKRWATADLRSVNAQVEFILREAIRRRRREKDDAGREGPPSGEDA